MSVPDEMIGARLKEARQQLDLSQQVFADSLGVSLRTYQNYERGHRPISKDLLCALIQQHGISLAAILTGTISVCDEEPNNHHSDPSVQVILERLAEVTGCKNDSALARKLNASRQSLSKWRSRGSVPYQLLTDFAATNDISLDYLLLGRKPNCLALDLNLLLEIHTNLREKWAEKSKSRVVVTDGFGERLKILRKRAGLSQTELGELAATGRPTISRIERGESNPPLDVVIKLAIKLLPKDNDMDWLLLGCEGALGENSDNRLHHIALIYNQVVHLEDPQDRARSIAGALDMLHALTTNDSDAISANLDS